MRVGLYLQPRSLSSSGNWSSDDLGASRAVSEDPAITCSIVLLHCFPWAFIPEASWTSRSNPHPVRCSSLRIDRTMAANARTSHSFTMRGCSSKKGRHSGLQIPERLDRVGQDTAPRALRTNSSAAKGRDHRFENLSMILVLIDLEDRRSLPPAMSVHHRVAMDRDGETTFTVHKSDSPVGFEHQARNGSFLLIVRTGWIFTTHAVTLITGCDRGEYHRILGCSSI
jgi:hypothetical protein